MELTQAQWDRARGVLIGTAYGDALGAPLEFGPVIAYPAAIAMHAGRGWEHGEWTDDTSMAIVIARALADSGGLAAALDATAEGWQRWRHQAKDVGIMTGSVLDAAARRGPGAEGLRAAAADYASHVGRHDGNGSLMRTAPVALAFLDDARACADAARAFSALTHAGQDSQDACVLWTNAIRVAILDGTTDGLRGGLELLYVDRRERWSALLDEAALGEPWDFGSNGWVVQALQAAWSAVHCQREHPGSPVDALLRGVDHAVRCGLDTDTVAAIAGGLLGALHGFDAVPAAASASLHGWPGLRAPALVGLIDDLLRSRGHGVEPQAVPTAT